MARQLSHETPEALASEISDLMLRLNAATLDAKALGYGTASELLSAAWTDAYDARAKLRERKVL